MSTAIHHAMSSAKKFGGEPEDYLRVHEFFDQFKNVTPFIRIGACFRKKIFGKFLFFSIPKAKNFKNFDGNFETM